MTMTPDPEHMGQPTEGTRTEMPNLPSRVELHRRVPSSRLPGAGHRQAGQSGQDGQGRQAGEARQDRQTRTEAPTRAIDLPVSPRLLGAVALVLGLVLIALLVWGMRSTVPQVTSSESGVQSGSNTPAQSAQSTASLFDLIKVSGRVGATPVLDLAAPIDIKGSKRRIYKQGEGRFIAENTPVLVSITAFDGHSGSVLNPSGRARLLVGHADAATLGEDLLSSVVGLAEGSRIVVVRSLNPNATAPGASSAVEIDVVDILPAIATGVVQEGANGNPLHVEMGDEGPVITHGSTEPLGLTTQLLLKGEGAQVNKDDNVVAQYIVMGWSDGIQRQSTWSTGVPELINLAKVMPGVSQALVDQRVGSRIAVTVPPDLATGDDTLAVVIDILGTEPASVDAQSPQSSGDSGSAQSGSVTSAPR